MDHRHTLMALRAFVAQRPGFDSRNYDSARSYRADLRKVAKHKADALALISGAERLIYFGTAVSDELGRSNGGRLEFERDEVTEALRAIRYHAGWYYALESRAAVCAHVAEALWASFEGTREERINAIAGLSGCPRRTVERWV